MYVLKQYVTNARLSHDGYSHFSIIWWGNILLLFDVAQPITSTITNISTSTSISVALALALAIAIISVQ
jgi:uncharacterized membrane protein YeiB